MSLKTKRRLLVTGGAQEVDQLETVDPTITEISRAAQASPPLAHQNGSSPSLPGNGLRGSDSSGKKISHDHTEKDSHQQVGWRDILPVHPAAELFPLMSKDELRELADDIAKDDLQKPVTLWRDPILGDCLIDRRNRLDALALLGEPIFNYPGKREVFYRGKRSLNCDFRRMDGNPSFDPYAYVISKNVHRRHLTPEQNAN
jgi:hypothetical protein